MGEATVSSSCNSAILMSIPVSFRLYSDCFKHEIEERGIVYNNIVFNTLHMKRAIFSYSGTLIMELTNVRRTEMASLVVL